jgi:hypothetical protein
MEGIVKLKAGGGSMTGSSKPSGWVLSSGREQWTWDRHCDGSICENGEINLFLYDIVELGIRMKGVGTRNKLVLGCPSLESPGETA